MFDSNETGATLAEQENTILKFWNDNHIFEKSVEERKGCKPYVFFDGPPFATGLPHYGHLLAGTIKDVIPRYQTMRGRYVPRTFGWDCHGLPIESLAQKALNLAGAPAIQQAGVDVFNEKCRSMVQTYVGEWKTTVNRMGRWVDFDHGYKTMDPTFMETVWWVFSQLWKQGRVYKAHRIVPYSWKLTTPLSNSEASANYKMVQDPTVTVRMKVRSWPMPMPELEGLTPYVVIWTTTPWTLPANLLACAGPELDYVVVKDNGTTDAYLLAKDRLNAIYKDPKDYTILRELKGKELVGTKYEPIFNYFEAQHPNDYRIVNDDYVTADDGTGIVHIAPAYGEDDYRICQKEGVALEDPLDAECCFTSAAPDFEGMQCKAADKAVIKWLKEHGKLVHQDTIVHSYPYCERTDTPLIYKAIDAWYVRVEDLHERLLKNNAQTTWMPAAIGTHRFANWLADAKDWNISRNRFWGSCIPLWINVDDPQDIICVDSVDTLEKLSGVKVTDLHKHFIDKIEILKDGKRYRRTPEVLDCWFESGSMPYAQSHYPFENKEFVEKNLPADFIAEGLDQTRGWFYALMVLSTALFDKPPFQHVVVNGLILAEDGHKMSKHLKNYPDPMNVIEKYGADALRLCLLASPVVRAEDLRFSETAVREIMRTVLLPLWNSYSFLATYARIDKWRPEGDKAAPPENPENVLDRWILSKLAATLTDVRDAMDAYDLQKGATRFTGFLDELTNWYIRRSRRRFWRSTNDSDKLEAYQTLHYVLLTFCKMAAPFIPFITENIYRNLRTDSMPESVHLCDYPEPQREFLDERLNERMAHTMSAVSLGRLLRSQVKQKVRQPLASAVLVSLEPQVREDLSSMADVIAEELNVKKVLVESDEEQLVKLSAKPNMKRLGPKYGKLMGAITKAVNALDAAQLRTLRQDGSLEIQAGETAVTIAVDDILLIREELPGMTVANEGDVTVALDTRLTPELEQEGWAREVVSKLQNIRKEMNLDVVDRITVQYDTDDQMLLDSIASQKEYISGETLALELTRAPRTDEFTTVDLAEKKASFRVRKA